MGTRLFVGIFTPAIRANARTPSWYSNVIESAASSGKARHYRRALASVNSPSTLKNPFNFGSYSVHVLIAINHLQQPLALIERQKRSRLVVIRLKA